ncbi:hypothetical protein [Segeticoccus rhizosphaerae]|uniref:hypothetical protein n=1 Tax=Segeticoccus rhizosphaerae TaxID=1104777 RepID=UPI0013968542|nr:hypothetical protein [Segeticoccus rhizosphaerae]
MPILLPVKAPLGATPPPPVSRRVQPIHLQHTWIDYQGREWDLCSGASGVVLMAGVRGMTLPPTAEYETESASEDGAEFLGFRTLKRPVFWPAKVFTADKAEWYAHDAAWWDTLHPDRSGQWRVTNPVDGTARRVVLRCNNDGDMAFDTDPGLTGWAHYNIYLSTLRSPFWLGALQARSFIATAKVPFKGGPGGTGKAPSFWISKANNQASASIDNPGTEDASLVYVLDGPQDAGATVGIGADTTTYNAAIADGKSVIIDTRVGRVDARLVDTPDPDLYPPRTEEWFARIEQLWEAGATVFSNTYPIAYAADVDPGDSQPISISFTGSGATHIALQPCYRRAW